MKKKRTLKSFRIDALPLLNAYIKGCQLSDIFEQFVPSRSSEKVPPSAVGIV